MSWLNPRAELVLAGFFLSNWRLVGKEDLREMKRFCVNGFGWPQLFERTLL